MILLDKKTIRFVSPEPKIANSLQNVDLRILPEELRNYLISWIQEVGTVMRSRDFMVSSVASYASSGIIAMVAKRLPKDGGIGIISGLFGETKR